MIDIHCHILHEMDDGPKDIETSVSLCEMAMENGIEKIIVTPHLANLYELDDFVARRDQKLSELRDEVDDLGMLLKIYAGAEVLISDDIFHSFPLEKVTLNASKYILVEFDFLGLGFSNVLRYIDEIFKMNLVPVIAHPERYSFLQDQYDRVNYLLDMGVLMQINAGSLASNGSRDEFDLAYEMALKNAATFIGTDAHSIRNRPNDLLRMLRIFPPNISQRGLNQMLNLAPEAVIKNESIMRSLDSGILKKRRYR